jgi:hypothetical protein
MSELPSPPPPIPTERAIPIGRLLAGLFLVALGVGWLLDALDVVTIDWDVVLPVALVLVGITLAVAAMRGESHGGLVALGIVLTVILTVGTAVDIPFGGGIGDRTEQPTSLAEVHDSYELSIGKLTLDLTGLPAEHGVAEVTIRAKVGMGQLVVLVPSDASPAVHASVGMGDAQVFDRDEGGVGVKVDVPGDGGVPYRIDLSVGLGQIQVQRE